MAPKRKASAEKRQDKGRDSMSGKVDADGVDVLPSTKRRGVCVETIASSPITALASDYWATPHDGSDTTGLSSELINHVYSDVLLGGDRVKVQLLELSGYLENYLWPFFSSSSSSEHIISILLLVNEKLTNDSSPFRTLSSDESKFQFLMERLVTLFLAEDATVQFSSSFIKFVVGAFRSTEYDVIKRHTLRYVTMLIWTHLSQSRLHRELSLSKALEASWIKFSEQRKALVVKAEPASSSSRRKQPGASNTTGKAQEVLESMSRDGNLVPIVVDRVLVAVERESLGVDEIALLDLMLDFLAELLSQCNSRRYLAVLMDDKHFALRCRMSVFLRGGAPLKTRKLFERVEDYLFFEIDDATCKPLSRQDLLERCNARIGQLQQLAFSEFPEKLRGLVFSSMGELIKRAPLSKHCALLSKDELLHIVKELHLFHDKDEAMFGAGAERADEDFIRELLLDFVSLSPLLSERLNKLPLYPTEEMLWNDEFILPNNVFQDNVLAAPKLNMQFLTMYDYFMRNFLLFLMESAYEIRADLMDAIKRMGPRQHPVQPCATFMGWARMALPVTSIALDEVAKPLIGEIVPRKVECSVTIDLSRFTGDIRQEWEDLREHDVVFLISIDKPTVDLTPLLPDYDKEKQSAGKGKKSKPQVAYLSDDEIKNFITLYGIKAIRGGTIFEHRDEANNILNDLVKTEGQVINRVGSKRKLRLRLDPAQYYADTQQGLNCYESFNLLVRRNAKENNFKAVLQTIRDLLNSESIGTAIPSWLHDVLLGLHSPASAHYRSLLGIDSAVSRGEKVVEVVDYHDAFLDAEHVVSSFPHAEVRIDPTLAGPYRLRIQHSQSSLIVDVERVIAAPRGPYAENIPLQNPVRFTPTQIEAIRTGVNEGLAVIIGPPGTGKTDCAVQIISNLYHSFPNQKILVVTHSNAALNDMFEKIMQRDVDPRHMLRLGSGESELRDNLQSNQSLSVESATFSKQGRVQWCLARRLQLLAQVQRLAASLSILGDFGSNCETSQYMYKVHVLPRIEAYKTNVERGRPVSESFPFHAFFADVPTPLFTGDAEHDSWSAQGCFNHLHKVFEEVADYRAFELLRTQALRTDYLLTKQARIVAMTCTHAAMTRARLVELGFKYDSVVIEEAAQILEVETVIPMLLQDSDPVTHTSRLKRVVLLGDAQQLPPIVQNQALAKGCRLEQSLFSRLLRLGVPSVTLDMQGRARHDLASIYSWKYIFPAAITGESVRELGNLPAVEQGRYLSANAGFAHTFQFVDVPDFNGKGESAPTPFYYQNLGEAEFVVATYQYMRLLGYPASKISIITTYNGQKHLIRDILQQRCKNSALFGFPAQVTTVDKYQGQQNDYVLLSLVRTEAVGHLRDVRRLVVALSRARLGLYVFGRLRLFETCFEMLPVLARLKQRPTALRLVAGEAYPCERSVQAAVDSKRALEVQDATAMGILVYQMLQQAQSLATAAK